MLSLLKEKWLITPILIAGYAFLIPLVNKTYDNLNLYRASDKVWQYEQLGEKTYHTLKDRINPLKETVSAPNMTYPYQLYFYNIKNEGDIGFVEESANNEFKTDYFVVNNRSALYDQTGYDVLYEDDFYKTRLLKRNRASEAVILDKSKDTTIKVGKGYTLLSAGLINRNVPELLSLAYNIEVETDSRIFDAFLTVELRNDNDSLVSYHMVHLAWLKSYS